MELKLEILRREKAQALQGPQQLTQPAQQPAPQPIQQPVQTLGERLEAEIGPPAQPAGPLQEDFIPPYDIGAPIRTRSIEGMAKQGLTPQQLGQAGTESSVGTGAMTGARIGAPLGPMGAVAGGAIGAAAGAAFEGGIKQRPPAETGMKALQEAKTDLYFSGLASTIRPLFQAMKIGRNKLLGVGDKEMENLVEARKVGVDLGATEASRFPAVRTTVKVVGRFPFLGTPAKEAAAKKAQQVFDAEGRLLARLGPTANLAEVGVDMNKAAQSAFSGFRDEAASLYKTARQLGDEAGQIIPTGRIKAMAQTIVDNYQAARPGREAEKGAIVEFAETLKDIPERHTASQFDALMKDLDQAMSKARNDGFDISLGMDLKTASEFDLRDTQRLASAMGDEKAQAFVDALKEADEFFTKGMQTFETATAKKFNRVTRKAFQVGLKKPGHLNEDELFRAAFNTRSPQAMRELQDLVGPKVFQRAVRGHIEKALEGAKDLKENIHIFNPDKFIKSMGMADPNSVEYAAMEEALKRSGINPKDFVKFADVASKALSSEVPNVSTFLARAAALKGARGTAQALVPGTTIIGGLMAGGGMGALSPAMAVLLTMTARGAVRLITSPKTLKLATMALGDQGTEAARIGAATRLLRMMAEEEEPIVAPEALSAL